MKMNGLIFVIGFMIAFAGGYLIFGQNNSEQAESYTPPVAEEGDESNDGDSNDANEEQEDETSEEVSLDADVEVLARNNCLSCHSVEKAGLSGGTTGPDLSNAYRDVEGKHGKTVDEFLQEPTSAVMSSVIEENPLDDEEREEIVKLLEEVAEK